MYMLVLLTLHMRWYLLLVHLLRQELQILEADLADVLKPHRSMSRRFFAICRLTQCINEIFSWSLSLAITRFVAVLTTDINFFYEAFSDNDHRFTNDRKKVA